MNVVAITEAHQPVETLEEIRNRHREEIDEYMRVVVASIMDVSRQAGLTLDDLRGPRRDKEASFARQLVMWHLRAAGYSLPEIGRFLNRDHTTILHGLRRIEQKVQEYKALEAVGMTSCKA